ncbi:hypothetical protein [Bilophila wadsworthia]|uniref:hypothetical protein n=1 Tax=Bilophila wadsworthia TaxID=35833 RepID=UPI0032602446
MRSSITIRMKNGRVTGINLNGKAANNFFKALQEAQEGENGKASETGSEYSDRPQLERGGRHAGTSQGA